MAPKNCFCGQSMKVVAIDVGQRFICPGCQAQDIQRDAYELKDEDVGASGAIAWLYRRERLISGATAELADDAPCAHDPDSAEVSASSETITLPDEPGSSARLQRPSSEVLTRRGSTERRAFDDADLSDSSKIGLGILPENARLGQYEIRGVLGQGGMGIVYEAHDTDLERSVALKVLNRDLCRNPRFIDRFRREARAAAGLNHPNITHVYSIGEDGGNHFFVMELVTGRNLADLLAEDGVLPSIKALDLIRQTAAGLRTAARRKIIHRDIKPSNLLVTPEGEVKITDFGLAKAVMGSAVELTTTGVVMGTPVYMSPEQSKSGAVDLRSDVYSLGATFYHLIVGKPPFDGDSPISIILKHLNEPLRWPEGCEVPAPVRKVIAKMMRKDPDDRYEDYDALLEDLDALMSGDEVSAPESQGDARLVVFHYTRPSASKSSLFRVGKLSLARTNLKLGRREKAVGLLTEIVDNADDTSLRAEAALSLLEIYERERDFLQARRLAEVVARCNIDGASSYALWKLARYDEEDALARDERALASYERLQLRCSPEHRGIIDECAARLEGRIESRRQALAGLQVLLVED